MKDLSQNLNCLRDREIEGLYDKNYEINVILKNMKDPEQKCDLSYHLSYINSELLKLLATKIICYRVKLKDVKLRKEQFLKGKL